jgi:hypothetical protein
MPAKNTQNRFLTSDHFAAGVAHPRFDLVEPIRGN